MHEGRGLSAVPSSTFLHGPEVAPLGMHRHVDCVADGLTTRPFWT